MNQPKPQQLSPDGYSRFFIMTNLLAALYPEHNQTFSLLDVGGSSPFMSVQLKNSGLTADLTIIDILPKPENITAKYVVGDATKMDFSDSHFDSVISTDVLEHISKNKKLIFIEECLRVAKDYVIIAAPFNTVGVNDAEHATNELNKTLFGQGQQWLEEHFEQTKPELSLVQEIFDKYGYESSVIGTNNLFEWIISTHINLIDAKLGLNSDLHKDINKKYNKSIEAGNEFTGPSYRHFVIFFKKRPTKQMLSRIEAVTVPSEKYPSAAVSYTSSLLKLVSSRLLEMQTTAKQKDNAISKLNVSLEDEKHKIAELTDTIKAQQSIIDRCKPYLGAYNSLLGRTVRRSAKIIRK